MRQSFVRARACPELQKYRCNIETLICDVHIESACKVTQPGDPMLASRAMRRRDRLGLHVLAGNKMQSRNLMDANQKNVEYQLQQLARCFSAPLTVVRSHVDGQRVISSYALASAADDLKRDACDFRPK
ncbi:unnamed protein product [Cercospora beticola]|nr:unnamed protein product [Cercospora beticola]